MKDVDAADGQIRPTWFHVVPDFLSPAECDRLEAWFSTQRRATARIGDHALDPDIRRSQVCFLPREPDWETIWARLRDETAEVNAARFGFDLDADPQSPQLAEYSTDEQGHYGWHVDRGGPGAMSRRKLTVAALLSDPASFMGGDLHLNPDGRPIQPPRKRGQAVFFPSYVVHRVTPVFRGVRRSLVAWFAGPDFR